MFRLSHHVQSSDTQRSSHETRTSGSLRLEARKAATQHADHNAIGQIDGTPIKVGRIAVSRGFRARKERILQSKRRSQPTMEWVCRTKQGTAIMLDQHWNRLHRLQRPFHGSDIRIFQRLLHPPRPTGAYLRCTRRALDILSPLHAVTKIELGIAYLLFI